MNNTNKDYLDQLSQCITIIPTNYVEALTMLHEKLDSLKLKWVVNGALAERLRLVKVDPDCIEIVTSKEGAEKIYSILQGLANQEISLQTKQLRNAVIGKVDYPVFARSYYFELVLNGITVKVEGDLQFKVGEWDWGEVFDFFPEFVYVTGKRIAVTPIPILYDFYSSIGWTDRSERIAATIKKPVNAKSLGVKLK
ncbi:MAG TPA: hypothetical protein VFF14_06495 [Candidatus Deferrimicrobium sp.]|nr:hypothetical protein [Candidatus Deferrimicrobium sp.]